MEELMSLDDIVETHPRSDAESFEQLRKRIRVDPKKSLRDIHLVFPQMFFDWVGEGIDEYPLDPESIGYKLYDFHKVCEKDCQNPYIADRPTQNRLMNHMRAIATGKKRKKITLVKGMTGSGKSFLIENLVDRFQEYMKTELMPEVVWRLNVDKIQRSEGKSVIFDPSTPERIGVPQTNDLMRLLGQKSINDFVLDESHYDIACPSHDHPITLIPKSSRMRFFEETIGDKELVGELKKDPRYKWIFYEEACGICQSIYQELSDRLERPSEIFEMAMSRPMAFNRTLGKGIGIFMPGNPLVEKPNNVEFTQKILDKLFGENKVKYEFSIYAKLNNGIVVYEDLKGHNIDNLEAAHGLISEGIWKIPGTDIEERHKSVKFVIYNPGDISSLKEKTQASMRNRSDLIKIKGILDYNTEVRFYQQYNDGIEKEFLPGVLENFAKMIVATRMDNSSYAVENWLGDKASLEKPQKDLDDRSYKDYLDSNGYLVRMLIWSGIIPEMIVAKDQERFKSKERRLLIDEAETQHDNGLSGRDVEVLLDDLLTQIHEETSKRIGSQSRHENRKITNKQVIKYMSKKLGQLQKEKKEGIDGAFDLHYHELFGVIKSIERYYTFQIEEQMKTALSDFKSENIENEILEYLHCILRDEGTKDYCGWTKREVTVSESYMTKIEDILLGERASKNEQLDFRKKQISRFNQDLTILGKNSVRDTITDTSHFGDLFNIYEKNKRANALVVIRKSWDIYKDAIIAYDNGEKGKKVFNTAYDKEVRRNVTNLLDNMQQLSMRSVSCYDLSGAKRVVIDYFDGLFKK